MRRLGFLALALVAAVPVHGAEVDSRAVAARVADEPIYLGELLEGAGSLALVGRENVGDAPGTRERLLERLVTARVLYLDARDRHLDERQRYRDDLQAMGDAILAARHLEDLRRREACAERGGDAACPDAGTRRAREVARLRAAAAVAIDAGALDPARDAVRGELAPVAHIGAEAISWRRVRAEGRPLGTTTSERAAEVERVIATHLLAEAARADGHDRDAGFQEMVTGWRRGELVRLAREEIVARKGLDARGVGREYMRHLANFTLPAERKVQQIVVGTRAEAIELRRLLAAPPPGTSFYTLARDRSIVPGASQTLGVIGWVTQDQGHPALAAAAFALAPGEISAPIETDAGFHIVRVLDQRAKEVQPLDDSLRERIRARWNANRITEYAARLAETKYPVTLYPDVYRLEERTAHRGS